MTPKINTKTKIKYLKSGSRNQRNDKENNNNNTCRYIYYYYIMDYGVGSELFFTSLLSNARDKAVYKVKVCIFHGSFFFLLL